MRKLYLIFAIASLLIGCDNNRTTKPLKTSSQELKFSASFADDGCKTRTYVDNDMRMYWHENDLISIFTNTLNKKYVFDGEQGATGGYFSFVKEDNQFSSSNDLSVDANYAIYPYNKKTSIGYDGQITAILPDSIYKESTRYVDSTPEGFGINSNTMVAATKNSEDTDLRFKNLCGYMKLQLYGEGVTIKSITLEGNNNE